MKILSFAPPATYVSSATEVERALNRCWNSKMLGVDTETLGKGYSNMNDQIVCMGLSPDPDSRFFVPRRYLGCFAKLLASNIPKALTNVKFDAHRFANAGIELGGPWADTVVLDFLLDEDTREFHHGLKECVRDYFGYPVREYEQIFGGIKITEIVPGHDLWDKFLDYASLDAWLSRKLALYLLEELDCVYTDSETGSTLKNLYWDTEAPQLKTLFRMERRGFRIDTALLENFGRELQSEMDSVARELSSRLKWPMNPLSTKQVQKMLFEDMGFEPISKTKKGAAQVNETVLEYFAKEENVEECKLILDYRGYGKLKGTYCEGIVNRLHTDGRIHTTFNPTMTTGRMSSANPNLQNIPVKSKEGAKIRGAFIAKPGCKLVVADYSQLEMRILAFMADERAMIQAFIDGLDMHAYTASLVFKIPYEEIMAKKESDPDIKEKRSRSKTVGFGILYGKSAHGLSKDWKCSKEEAQEFIDMYLDTYPGVRDYMNGTIAYARKFGYVQTISGRFRRLSKIASNNFVERGHAERQALNCFDEKTYALTTRGWIPGREVRDDEVVLTKQADTGELEWQKVTAVARHEGYKGEVVEFSGRNFSARTTPHHRWLVYNKSSKSNECKISSEISKWGDHRIHRTGKYLGTASKLQDDEVRLLGWILTDCYFREDNRGVRISQSLDANPEKCEEIQGVLDRLKIKHGIRDIRGCRYWEFYNERAVWARALVPGRKLTMDLLLSLGSGQAEILLETYIKANGWLEKSKAGIVVADQNQAELVQILVTLAGKHATVLKRLPSGKPQHSPKVQPEGVTTRKPWYEVRVLSRNHVQINQRQKRITEAQDEFFWCVSVPNTYLIVRRAGHVYVSGNTPIQGTAADIVKKSMILCDNDAYLKSLECDLLLQIHDELIFEVPEENAEECASVVRDYMENPYPHDPLSVPMEVEPKICDTWQQGK